MTSARIGVLVVCVLGFASGCRGRPIVDRFPPPPPFVLGERMPDDFECSLETYDDAQPRSDLVVEVRADGTVSWRVWAPATKTESDRGVLHLNKMQVVPVWKAVADAKFDRIDEGDPPPNVCRDGASETDPRMERLSVWAGGNCREVWRPPGAADVAPIRNAVLDLVTRDVAPTFTAGRRRADDR